MKTPRIQTRREVLGALAIGGSSLLLAGCERIIKTPLVQPLITGGEKLTFRAQRAIMDRNALAREFSRSDLSPVFRANGSRTGGTPEYQRHVAEGFANWRLRVDGLVNKPLALSLADLQRLPQRTQITRHDCVEGWSAIGEWTGVVLGGLLQQAGLQPNAQYLVFHCADAIGGTPYYESIDLIDAFHPQTILAHRLNGSALPVGNGAPLRLRVERQLGYKQAKYLMRVEAVASMAAIGKGKGGYWEDRIGYEWYAGI